MATKNFTVSNHSDEKSPYQNPMIGDDPSDTIGRVVGALQWLNAADGVIERAFEGEPIDSIKFGRFLLGACCTDALKAAEDDLCRQSAAAKAKEEVSHD